MPDHQIVSHDEWIAARRRFLAKEKEFTRLRDELSRERRELPWEHVKKEYLFEAELPQLFLLGGQLQRHHPAPRAAGRLAGRRFTRAAREASGPGAPLRLDVQVGLGSGR